MGRTNDTCTTLMEKTDLKTSRLPALDSEEGEDSLEVDLAEVGSAEVGEAWKTF